MMIPRPFDTIYETYKDPIMTNHPMTLTPLQLSLLINPTLTTVKQMIANDPEWKAAPDDTTYQQVKAVIIGNLDVAWDDKAPLLVMLAYAGASMDVIDHIEGLLSDPDYETLGTNLELCFEDGYDDDDTPDDNDPGYIPPAEEYGVPDEDPSMM